MMILRRALAALLCTLCLAQSASALEQHWAFVGIWDRSMPQVDAASREAGIGAKFFRSDEFAALTAARVSEFPLVFVLNLTAEDGPALTQRLKAARELNPQQRVLSLDTRGSQADLDKAGLLTTDEAIIAYWRPNGKTNIERLLRYVLMKYAGAAGEIQPPVMIPESGYYDPDREDPFEKFDDYAAFKQSRQRWIDGAPTAVLIIQQSFWITHDLKVVDAQIHALEKHGLNVVVVFGDREANVADLTRAAKPDVLIEDRHGSMWEGNALLKELNVPYLRPISMLAYTIDEWRRDPRGLATRDVGLFMALQESWGTIEPVVVGGLQANILGFKLHDPIPDRIERFAARAARWAALHRKPNAEKKIAIIYYNKGLGQDDLMRGSPTGGFLDAPESLVRFLPRMQADGFKIEGAPGSAADLIAEMKRRGRNIGPWAQGDLEKLVDEGSPVLIPLSTYRRWFEEKLSPANQQAVIKQFGPPPGKLMVVTRNGEPQIVLPRIKMGNILLMPQPERGEKQDEALLHSRDVPSPHNYLAFYWWLQGQFEADAIVHWGTHGSLELLPGKEAGLSGEDWSDICAGDTPIINLWITDNLGEATLSRRRSYALLVDHLPPPALSAGLQDGLRPLHESIHKFTALEPGLLREEFRKTVTRETREAHDANLEIAIQPTVAGELFDDAAIARLDTHLHLLYESRTPLSLHILGQPPAPNVMTPYLVNILGESFIDHLADARIQERSLHHATEREHAAEFLDAALAGKTPGGAPLTPAVEKDVKFAREVRAHLLESDREITGLLTALNGRYVEAGPGPDPIRNPATVPTGRHLYSLNPEEIPTREAWNVARKLVDQMLAERTPKKVAMDLNGMNTMRDFGVMEGQILALLGVRPVWNRNNLVIDVELVPAAELKHPRVDVFIAMGGQYKENFPSRVALLDKAVKLAATAPEPRNAARDGAAATRERLLARGFSSARAEQFSTARIFGTKPGNMSGTNILYLVPRSGVWDKDDEIAGVYMDNMSFVYAGGVWGEKIDGLYEEALQGTDTVLRVWASNMTSQLSNHHAYEYLGGLSMAVKKITGKTPEALIADVRDPSGARIRSFEEVLAASLASELLNPRWIEGMKAHDYAGAGHIAELVKNTFGWSVTRPESVSQQTWKDIYETYLQDRAKLGLDEWFERVSPHAQQEITATLLEAARKEYWNATAKQIADLAQRYAESIAKHGDSGGLVSGGNMRLVDYATKALNTVGHTQLAQQMQKAVEKSAAAGGETKVTGQKLEAAAPPSPPPGDAKTMTPAKPGPWFTWPRAIIALVLLLIVAGFVRRSGAA